MRLFDFSLKVNGFKIDEAKAALSKIQAKNDSDFQAYVEEQKKSIISYHLEHNSFYKTLGTSIKINDWNSVPIITKRNLQQPIEQRLSDGFTTKNVYLNKTSGSSGDPFIFAKDKWCHAMTWAEIMSRFAWYGIDFNSSRQARFYGIPLDKKGYYKERLKDWFSNRFRFSVFDLSDATFETALTKFKTDKFDFINGYTSPIVQFAKYLKQKDVILTSVCPTLKVCIVTSEMLFDDDKTLMETQFGVPVVNEYGASELDLIAFQNTNDEWQVNNETLYVEILDVNGNVLPLGKEGRIVITSLYNKAHPLIRYDVGDIGILSEKSTLRKPILKKLVGRTNDIAILPSGKKAAGLTFYYITKSVIENDGNVSEFVIEQLALDSFMIQFVSRTELSNVQKEIITAEMERYLEPGIKVNFERVPQLKRTKAGKLKQFISKL
ncbi:phenylacetate--CoA ligase family protein [Winogradskyella litoriviva]|uniref:Phenylacetate--CoA ligase family protein n=1 Tax=Winogradskyella litoriviva TaxID=1220182 RepID=A0ABX2E1I5_9FLAO|nr:phenylacetate--CoA ligase family protein [Winogradskyella litoriviva]NRD22150.1 phenylacetate--CoA ligase family protein [Winogradskyella litoriviva]